jgi:hypothetical protein
MDWNGLKAWPPPPGPRQTSLSDPSQAAARAALALNGHEVDGAKLKVSISDAAVCARIARHRSCTPARP